MDTTHAGGSGRAGATASGTAETKLRTLARKAVCTLAALAMALALVPAAAFVQPSRAYATSNTDDYPWKTSSNTSVDSYGWYCRYGTSFVGWRMHNDNGVSDFTNWYKGQHWGDAKLWPAAARNSGFTVDGTPAVGSIAYTTSGRYGHVAWVMAVQGSAVTVEEYNYGSAAFSYNVRTVDKSAFEGYIHVKDLTSTASEVSVAEGSYTIYSKVGDKALDVSGGAATSGANVQIWTPKSSDSQTFDISYDTAKYGYRLAMKDTTKYLDTSGNLGASGINVQLWGNTGALGQYWIFQDAGDGYAYIHNLLGYYLDVNNAQNKDGANVQTFSFNGSDAQKWKLVKAEEPSESGAASNAGAGTGAETGSSGSSTNTEASTGADNGADTNSTASGTGTGTGSSIDSGSSTASDSSAGASSSGSSTSSSSGSSTSSTSSGSASTDSGSATASGSSSGSSSGSGLGQVGSVSSSGKTKTSITVTWPKVSGAKKYQVGYRKKSASTWKRKTSHKRSCKIGGLKKGTAYCIRVRAIRGSKKGAWSVIVIIWTAGASKTPKVSKPKGASKSSSSARVSWAKVSRATKYQVGCRKRSGGVWKYRTVKGTSCSLGGLVQRTAYQVRVRACRGKRWGSWSVIIVIVIQAAKPAQVKDVKTVAQSTTSCKVSWPKVKYATSYEIAYRKKDATTWTYRTVTGRSCVLKGLSPSTVYMIMVRAINGSRKGNWYIAVIVKTKSVAAKATESSLLSSIEDSAYGGITKSLYGDYDGDGTKETFAIVGDDEIWFAGATGPELVYSTDVQIYEPPSRMCTVSAKQKLATFETGAGGSGSASVCFYVKNGVPIRVEKAGHGLTQTSKRNFTVYANVFDHYWNSGHYEGHTYKHYYLRWNGSQFVEYKGKRISQSKLKKYKGAKAYLRKARKLGYRIGKIFYRKNGIINVNLSKKDGTMREYENLTLKVKKKRVKLQVQYKNGSNIVEKSSFGGIYKASGF